MTRVIVADDQALVREGIRTLLEVAGIEVVAEAEDGAQAVAVIEEHAPEVALLDLRMPRHDGIWALEQLREQGSAVPVLVLTTFDDDQLVLRALRDGVEEREVQEAPLQALTPREIEVLRLVAEGCSNREIAEVLHLAEGTVKNHLSVILQKTGSRDRTSAVLRALREGLLG